jgi:hypothetical protein
MLAVEKGAVPGVTTDKNATRIVVAGDSLFLANNQLDQLANRDFAGFAINWLLERPELAKDLGPKEIKPYRLIMSSTQRNTLEFLLLVGMPGGTLLIGGLMWLRRRR